MSGYGRFEIVEELVRRGPFAVSSARSAGEVGAPAFAIKTYRNDAGLLDEDIFARESAKFIDCAKLQATLAQAGGKSARWGTIHASGTTFDAAYYVTDLYPRTLADLIDRRREQTPREIAHVLSRIVEGLTTLRDKAKRAHGRLTPSNILVGDGELDEVAVVLTDPAHSSDLSKRADAADVNALGEILFGMVMHRGAPKGGSIAVTPEWKVFRQQGEALRALCEKLINVQSASEMPLESVREKLEEVLTLKGAKGKTPIVSIAAAALVLIAGVAVGGIMTDWFGLVKKSAVVVMPTITLLADPRNGGQLWQVERLNAFRQAIEEGKRKYADEDCAKGERIFLDLDVTRKAVAEEVKTAREESWPTAREIADVAALKADQEVRTKRYSDITAKVGALEASLATGTTDAAAQCAIVAGTDPVSATWYAATMKEREDAFALAKTTLEDEGGEAVAVLTQVGAQQKAFIEAVQEARDHPFTNDQESKAAIDKRNAARDLKVPLETAVSKAQEDSRARLVTYVNGNRDSATALAGSSQALKAAFERVFEKVDPSDIAVTWQVARVAIQGLKPWLDAINAELPTSAGVAQEEGSLVNPVAFEAEFIRLRMRGVEALAGGLAQTGVVPSVTDATFVSAIAAQKQALQGWVNGAKVVAVKARQIEEALRQAYALDEVLAQGASIQGQPTLRSVRDGLAAETSGQGAYASSGAAVAPVLAKVVEVEQVSRAAAAPALLAMIPAKGAAVQQLNRAKIAAAWERLSAAETGWPASATDLDQVLEVGSRVKEALSGVIELRRAKIVTKVDTGVRTKWVTFVTDRAGADPANVIKAYEVRDRFGVTAATIDALPKEPRFNFMLIEARAAVDAFNKGPSGAGKDPAQLQALAGILRGIQNKAAELKVGSDAGELIAYLDRRSKTFESGKAGASWTDIGPGAAVTKWSVVRGDDDNGTFVEYSWTGPSGRNHRLYFKKVAESVGEGVSYVATTETSLGLFADVMAASGKGEMFDRIMTTSDSIASNDQRGPLVWRSKGAKATFELVPGALEAGGLAEECANGWIASTQGVLNAGLSLFPAGLAVPAAPSWDTPVNYVSPMAALLAARTMNCRLPTDQEWVAASREAGGDTNLRDAAWKLVFDQFLAMNQPATGNGKAGWANGQIARPAEKTGLNAQEDTEPAVAANDGVVWFRPVQAGSDAMRDVVGNVAEFVASDAAAIRSITDDQLALSPSIKTFSGAVSVIGGSALSPAEPAPETPIVLAGSTVSALKRGFSDVGFRLAFTSSEAGGGAGAQPGLAVLKKLNEQGFLAAK